jgi:hypothetical protein
MVLIEVDGNYISVEPMKSREAGEMIRAYMPSWTDCKAEESSQRNKC